MTKQRCPHCRKEIEEPIKHELVCELCGMFIEITEEQFITNIIVSNKLAKAYGDIGLPVKPVDLLNKIYETIECEHSFRWINSTVDGPMEEAGLNTKTI